MNRTPSSHPQNQFHFVNRPGPAGIQGPGSDWGDFVCKKICPAIFLHMSKEVSFTHPESEALCDPTMKFSLKRAN